MRVMTKLRSIAIAISLMIHASIGYAMLPAFLQSNVEAIDLGKGDDVILVEQGIAIEGLAKLGDALETIETVDVTPVDLPPPPPPQEVKPVEELRDAITAADSKIEDVVRTEEPPPQVVEPPKPDPLKEQPQQIAMLSEQSSGAAKTGGDAKAVGLYLGRVNEQVQRAKVNPRARTAGIVVMNFTIGLDGALLSKEIASSSGSKVLDDAATAALDRAAPFPPIPPEVSAKPLAFTQPFKFITR